MVEKVEKVEKNEKLNILNSEALNFKPVQL